MSNNYRNMKGSFAEELVNSTIRWYLERNIALFRKSYIPMTIVNKLTNVDYASFIQDKGDIDYYGVYKGQYISFEVKETNKEYFIMSQLKEHQRDTIFKLHEMGAVSFLMITFTFFDDATYLFKAPILKKIITSGKGRIKCVEAIELGAVHVPIAFPGIIDFLAALQIYDPS